MAVLSVARRAVLGRPAFSAETGELVGLIADVLCSRDARRVIGLLLQGRGRRRRVVPFEEVAAIGGAAVMLRRAVALPTREGPRLREMRARSTAVVGRFVLAADGRQLGVIDDLVFEGGSGHVLGFAVSGGLIQDLLHGQGYLPLGAGVAWRGRAVVVGGPGGEIEPGEVGQGGKRP